MSWRPLSRLSSEVSYEGLIPLSTSLAIELRVIRAAPVSGRPGFSNQLPDRSYHPNTDTQPPGFREAGPSYARGEQIVLAGTD